MPTNPSPVTIGDLTLTPEVIEALSILKDDFSDSAGQMLLAETALKISSVEDYSLIDRNFFCLLSDLLRLLHALESKRG